MERTDKQNGRFETAHGEDEDGTVSVPSSPLPLCLNNMEMLEKARELFHLCDKEGKGFITKADMQRLQCELPLTTEQLEAVFDNLEQNNNGYLTPVEFSMGLGKFIGIEQYQSSESTRHEETFESGWSDDLDQTDEEEKRFCSLLEQLDSFQVFEDQSEVQELWARLRKEQPELLGTFEELIFRISSYLKDVQQEKESMELVLKRREIDHDREIRCLYEEMEQQIKAEREQLLCQVNSFLTLWMKAPELKATCTSQLLNQGDKSRIVPALWGLISIEDTQRKQKNQKNLFIYSLQESTKQGKSSLLQKELRNKEQEFEKMLCHQKKLELQLQSQNSMQLEIRVQNERLQILNESLLDQLERSRWELEVAQGQLQHLQKEAQLEQEQKDRDVFKVSKNMQKEKKSLLRQLELLREMNKKLRDERDAFEAKKLTATERKKSQWKKGSMIGKYLVEEKPAKCQLFPGNFPLVLPEDTIMEEPTNNNCKLFPKSMTNLKDERGTNLSVKQSTASRKVTEKQKISRNSGTPRSLKSNTNRREMHEPMDLLLFPRGKPIDDDTKRSESSPDRVFKVVFLGNSGVGKSSFIHRFCYNRFLSEINSTIGIDYQVKSLMVDNMQVVLQLWDTAGQERMGLKMMQ
nr:PREDICTED: EF-hand calcium-binding domain-containing protein 4A isoform X3 [Anolis carolinensis]|eukprot:XP_016846246.1 PREDICTED: EF-hand calcium-binding domain-containing protein 4A isoform X3 [Anolis carolinensis]